jgi:hypothetical protein
MGSYHVHVKIELTAQAGALAHSERDNDNFV